MYDKAHTKEPEKINNTFRWPMVGISLADSYMIKYWPVLICNRLITVFKSYSIKRQSGFLIVSIYISIINNYYGLYNDFKTIILISSYFLDQAI